MKWLAWLKAAAALLATGALLTWWMLRRGASSSNALRSDEQEREQLLLELEDARLRLEQVRSPDPELEIRRVILATQLDELRSRRHELERLNP